MICRQYKTEMNFLNSVDEMAEAAANDIASILNDAIVEKGKATIIAATGNSQLKLLEMEA